MINKYRATRLFYMVFIVFIVLLSFSIGAAEKQWVEMYEMEMDENTFYTAEIEETVLLSDFAAGDIHYFRTDGNDKSYTISFHTATVASYYTFNINNNGVVVDAPYGIAFSGEGFYFYLKDSNGDDVANWTLSSGESSVQIRLEPFTIYRAVFISYDCKPGTVSFEIIQENDVAADSQSEANELSCGNASQETIAVVGDNDWFLISARQNDATACFMIESRINTKNMTVSVWNEFGECYVSKNCPYKEKVLLNWEIERGIDFYIQVTCTDAVGRYFYGFCDGVQHTFCSDEIIRKPTCTTDGESGQVCIYCKNVNNTKRLSATGHTVGSFAVIKNATCEREGLKEQRCLTCDTLLDQETIPMTEHKPGEAKIEKKATCTGAGDSVVRCNVCSCVLEEDKIPALGHEIGSTTIIEVPTCTQHGIQHVTCSRCGIALKEEFIDPIGHKKDIKRTDKKPTCTENGVERVYCSICETALEEYEIAAVGHVYGEWIRTVEPTYKEEGIETSTCEVCGDVREQKIAKKSIWDFFQ